ncbi:tegument protein G75 [Equid gammaherpesvirus 2]|nr:tegument protein G75 [Equid gammaherpesvirus 2]
MASDVTQLLPGIPYRHENQELRVYYADSEFSPAEGRFVFNYTGRAGDLTLLRGRSDAEHLLVVILRNGSGDEDLRPLHAPELRLLHFILAPEVRYSHLDPRSRLEGGGDRSLTFDYGPALYRRVSTDAFELGRVLTLIDCRSLLRVELGRHFVTRLAQYIGEDEMRVVHEALVNDTSVQRWTLGGAAQRGEVPATALTPAAEGGAFVMRDPVSIYLMLPRPDNAMPLGIQASTAASPLVRQYIILTTPGTMSVFPWGSVPKNPSVREAVTHLHSEATSMGQPQLQGQVFQLSLLPFYRVSGAACGVYSVTPSVASGYEDAVHGEIRETHEAHARCLNHSGVPVTCGFLRTFDETSVPLSLNTLACTSTLATCPVSMLTTSRFMRGQYIVALGDFLPVGGPDAPPYVYRSSSFLCNTIVNTLNMFGKTRARICISGTSRQVGFASTHAHLGSLLPRGGAVLYLSKLPREALSQIRGRGVSRENLRELVNRFYLRVSSHQVFLVLKDEPVGDQGRQGYQFLQKAAGLNGCPFRVLGRTCDQEGLHFVDDLGEGGGGEVPPRRMGYSPEGAAFSLPFESPVKKTTREYAEGVDVQRGMTLVQEGALEWDMFTPYATVHAVLSHPTVASKEYFVRRVDRFSNGLVRQQQGVGALDLPLADYCLVVDPAVETFTGTSFSREAHEASAPLENINVQEALELADAPERWFDSNGGAAARRPVPGHVLACGEQGYKMINSGVLGGQYGITEVVTNIMLGPAFELAQLQITAAVHWNEGPDYRAQLERAVMACREFCADLGVGLAFSSGCSSAKYGGPSHSPPGPDSLNLISFAGKARVDTSAPRLTPELHGPGHVLIHLSVNREVLVAGSVFEHKMTGLRHPLPPVEAHRVRNMFQCVQALVARGLVTAGHDVSDGGLIACCAEMALAGQCGVTLDIQQGIHPLLVLFSETPGAVLEVPLGNLAGVLEACEPFGCFVNQIGTVEPRTGEGHVVVTQGGSVVFRDSLANVMNSWTSFADEQFSRFGACLKEAEMYRKDYGDNELDAGSLEDACASGELTLYRSPGRRVGAAVLCLPGCTEPLAALHALVNSGFEVSVVGPEDLASSRDGLGAFAGLVVSGVTGARANYAASRGLVQGLVAERAARETVLAFLNRTGTFSLGLGELGMEFLCAFGVFDGAAAGGGGEGGGEVGRGLTDQSFGNRLIELEANASELPESLWLNFRVPWNTRSVALRHLAGNILPCWAYGTHLGVRYRADGLEYSLDALGMIALHYHGRRAQDWNFARNYPRNPTAVSTVAGLCSRDGRHLGLLCDPSAAYHPWQWQHVPRRVAGLRTSPWAVLFHTLFLDTLKSMS